MMLLCGCDSDYMMPDNPQQLYVVEGWIDNDDSPVVILTKSLPIDKEKHTEDDINELVVSDAVVTVECDGVVYKLTPRMTTQYFPPIIYTNKQLKGEVGKTYVLNIDTPDGKHLSAKTTIPAPVALDDICYEALPTCDTLYQVKANFRDDPKQKNYYKVFARVRNERFVDAEDGYYGSYYVNSYLSPIISVFDDNILGEKTELKLTRGFMNYVKDPDAYYLRGDEIDIKFTQIDAQSYLYWDEYQNQIIFGTNYMFHGARNNVSTIEGGLGSWCGYGATYYKLKIAE